MPYLIRDKVALYYEQSEGAERPAVLIHGWCCDHTFLSFQANHLARLGHPVIAIDLRGHGQSDKPEQDYPIAGFSEDIAWMCRELGLQKPLLLGHSLGGILAFDIAARWPDLPGAIAMLDAAIFFPTSARAAIPGIVERLRQPGYRDDLRQILTAVFFLPTDDPQRRDRLIDTMSSTRQDIMASAYAGLYDFDAEMARGRIKVPSLYIAANEPSPRCDIAALRSLLPDVYLGQTVGSGHFCQLEVPEQVNAMLDRFMVLKAI